MTTITLHWQEMKWKPKLYIRFDAEERLDQVWKHLWLFNASNSYVEQWLYCGQVGGKKSVLHDGVTTNDTQAWSKGTTNKVQGMNMVM